MVLLMSRLLDQHSGTRHTNADRPCCFGLWLRLSRHGPVTSLSILRPVTDNAQSVYELSLIEQIRYQTGMKKDYNIDVNFERAKEMLEANDGAGNTFKPRKAGVIVRQSSARPR